MEGICPINLRDILLRDTSRAFSLGYLAYHGSPQGTTKRSKYSIMI
jgi:hypothetical protein